MLLLDDLVSAVVFDAAELANIVSTNSDIHTIYLGDNITLTTGIQINPYRAALTIDGVSPLDGTGVTHTLTGFNSSSATGTIYLNQASTIALTLQNMTIVGRNFYGMPCIHDIAGVETVSVSYRNVTFSGPQLVWHVRGLTRLIDCDITIAPGYSAMQEVGEVCRVEIGGLTRISQPNTGSAVFYFYKSAASLTILADADVEVSTNYDFIYHEGSYYVPVVIQPRARFTLSTERSICRDSGHRFASFLVDEDAYFHYTRRSTSGDTHALYLNGPLTVNRGATFYMEANFTGTTSLVRLMTTAAAITLVDPKRVVFYKRAATGSSSAALSFAAAVPFSLTGGQTNFWRDATPFPDAGTIDDPALHQWHKPDWSVCSISGTAAASGTTGVTSSFTTEELQDLPALSDLQLHLARVLSIGELPLALNPVRVAQSLVTGTTDPLAVLRLTYDVGPLIPDVPGVAGPDGNFAIQPPQVIPFSSVVRVFSNTPFLMTVVVSAAEGELSIAYAPPVIEFTLHPLTTAPFPLLPRSDPTDGVTISDTRTSDRTEWQLFVRTEGPFMNDEEEILPDAVVFGMPDGSLVPLSDQFLLVVTDGPYPETSTPITWDENRGILAQLRVSARAGKRYSAQLEWEVRPVTEDEG